MSAWLVWIGSLLSALWILIANSWMQTPAGYKIENGKAVLTSFWAAALNPSIGPRYFHTVAAALLTGCFVVAGVCAYYMLKKRHLQFARQAHALGGLRRPRRLAIAMPFLGHWGALVVAEHQPVKMAAFENVDRHARTARPCGSSAGSARKPTAPTTRTASASPTDSA